MITDLIILSGIKQRNTRYTFKCPVALTNVDAKNWWPTIVSASFVMFTLHTLFHIHDVVQPDFAMWCVSIVSNCKQFHKLSVNYHLQQIWFLHLQQIKFIDCAFTVCVVCDKCAFEIPNPNWCINCSCMCALYLCIIHCAHTHTSTSWFSSISQNAIQRSER